MKGLHWFATVWIVILGLCFPLGAAWATPQLQTPTPQESAAQLLNQLTPEERIGQLFLVTFHGQEVGSGTPIYDLLTQHYIGGVVLLNSHNNFSNGERSAEQASELVRRLQLNRNSLSRTTVTNKATGESFQPAYIPLLIGIIQEGDGLPYDQLIAGLTPLPNQMAIGATWNPESAQQVGAVLGQELSALGINLLMGPSLDVLDTPHSEGSNDLGTRTFGGDPYWVSEMGRAFIAGLHYGSQNKLAVIAKHFPGYGSSDRLPEEEVSTVRKSLEELKAFDLVPFFAVTGNAGQPEAAAEGLLSSHIRYQGFQGNIRATTRPLSFDPQAFNLLMNLPEISVWRQRGGLMVSDNLGSMAIRRFYNLTNQEFDARRVALNAFVAGNDLLYIADFTANEGEDAYSATVRTLEFFTQKYREDAAFAQQVNESVARILALKYRLYGNFSLARVLPAASELEKVGTSQETTFNIARQAATLISPPPEELEEALADSPGINDRILFINDARQVKLCEECQSFTMFASNALRDSVLRKYGPQAGGQVVASNLRNMTFSDLNTMLSQPDQGLEYENEIRRAQWIVFALLDSSGDPPPYQVLRRFLEERPDLIQRKQLILFAFNAPYYLDATNISKLSAFYCLYSKAPPFVDIATSLLFREVRPAGAPPVSVPGIRYDLNSALFPNPKQIIPLELDIAPPDIALITGTPEPPPAPAFKVGEAIPLRAGVVMDLNGNPVPDGTPVEFIIQFNGISTSVRQTEVTQKGIVHTKVMISSSGSIEIYAQSELARSQILRFDIPAPGDQIITITPTASPTPTFTPSPTLTTTPAPPPLGETHPSASPAISDWLMAILMVAVLSWLTFRLGAMIGQTRWGLRAASLAATGGLMGYNYLLLNLPGSQTFLENSRSWAVFWVTLAGIVLGLFTAGVWKMATRSGEEKG